ncbi:MAG: ATP-binding protein, partial [Treponema sp.]|nr:ATP-binding protein [Treponema sp.]
DIATEFKGRGSIVHVLPLSFSEYCEGLQQDADQAWKDYIRTGGIPLVALMRTEEERVSYLKGLCEETYLKDIITHNGVRKKTELAETFDILASTIGTPVNPLKLANTFRSVTKKEITDDSISNFIGFFTDAFLVSKAEKYNIKGKKYISSPFKIYFEDIGVRNARLNFRQIEETHIMENILYNELRYRDYAVDVGEINVSEKTDRLGANGSPIYAQKSLEVDFIASKGDEKLYIQSALSMDSAEKIQQEKRSLYYIDDSFRKIVITKNNLLASIDEKGVETIDLFEFLLSR